MKRSSSWAQFVSMPTVLIGSLWVLAMVAGVSWMNWYEASPGRPAVAPSRLPAAAARGTVKPLLMVFLHPQCPCSHATVEELGRLLVDFAGRVDARVYFVQPRASKDWENTSLVARARAFRSLTVQMDPGGVVAKRFGVRTSGEVLLFGTDGKLAFAGGITESRGHEGDNLGLDALRALCAGENPVTRRTPVFGCAFAELGYRT